MVAASLQADEHEDGDLPISKREWRACPSQDPGEFVADNFDHLLGRGEALGDFLSNRPLLDALLQVLRHLVVNVRLEEGPPNFAEHGRHLLGGDFSVPLELLEGLFELFRELFKHRCASPDGKMGF